MSLRKGRSRVDDFDKEFDAHFNSIQKTGKIMMVLSVIFGLIKLGIVAGIGYLIYLYLTSNT